MFDREEYRRACSGLTLGREKIEEMIAMTENGNKKRVMRPVRVVLLAAALAAVLGVTALAANPAVQEQIKDFFMSFSFVTAGDGSFSMTTEGDLAGGSISVTVDGDPEGGDLFQTANAVPEMAYEVRDGRNILTIGGEERDVTEAMEKDGCYETAGEGYTLKLLPDGTALLELTDGEGNRVTCELRLDGTGTAPRAGQSGTGENWTWTEEDGN